MGKSVTTKHISVDKSSEQGRRGSSYTSFIFTMLGMRFANIRFPDASLLLGQIVNIINTVYSSLYVNTILSYVPTYTYTHTLLGTVIHNYKGRCA